MEGIIKVILETTINAPSGHNYQPWKFHIKESTLSVFNIPERDTTIYNFLQRGSFVAHGALIENIVLGASQHNYATYVTLFPERKEENLVATIDFQPSSEIQPDNLFSSISKRTTNRKPYKNTSLEDAHRKEIFNVIAGDTHGITLHFIEDSQKKQLLAESFSTHERLVLENYYVHQSLFPHVIWNEKEESEKRCGLYIKTFELPLPARVAFRLFKHWNLAHALGKHGLSKNVAKQNTKTYASASAIGLIAIPNDSNTNFIHAGRALERIWLKATQLELSLQPVTAMIYLGQRITAGDIKKFSQDQVQLIQNAYDTIKNVFNISSETMAMTFRIGYDGIPSAYSSKLPPHIES